MRNPHGNDVRRPNFRPDASYRKKADLTHKNGKSPIRDSIKPKVFGGRREGGRGREEGSRSPPPPPPPPPPPVLLPFNLQQHIIDQPRLAETEGEGAEDVAFEPIHLGEHGGIDH